MQSLTLSAEPISTGYCQNAPELAADSIAAHFAEEDSADHGNAVKGAMFGILLGAGCWSAIFGIVAMLRH